jgi:methylmalonyl-CoA mutase cobalamin-binding subunit
VENLHQKGVAHAAVVGKVIPPQDYLIEVQ